MFGELFEATMSQIGRKQKSITRLFPDFYSNPKKVPGVIEKGGVRLQGIEGDTWNFQVHSGTEEDVWYDVTVRFKNLEKDLAKLAQDRRNWKKDKSGVDLKKVASKLFQKADVELACSCPAQLYWGGDYILSKPKYQAKYGDPESRPPDERNPKQYGAHCKHIEVMRKVYPFYKADMAKWLKKNKMDLIRSAEDKARQTLKGFQSAAKALRKRARESKIVGVESRLPEIQQELLGSSFDLVNMLVPNIYSSVKDHLKFWLLNDGRFVGVPKTHLTSITDITEEDPTEMFDALISSGAVRGDVIPEEDSLIVEYGDQGGLTPQQIKKLIQFAEKYNVHKVYADTDDGSRSHTFKTTRELSDFLRGVAHKQSLAAQFHESRVNESLSSLEAEFKNYWVQKRGYEADAIETHSVILSDGTIISGQDHAQLFSRFQYEDESWEEVEERFVEQGLIAVFVTGSQLFFHSSGLTSEQWDVILPEVKDGVYQEVVVDVGSKTYFVPLGDLSQRVGLAALKRVLEGRGSQKFLYGVDESQASLPAVQEELLASSDLVNTLIPNTYPGEEHRLKFWLLNDGRFVGVEQTHITSIISTTEEYAIGMFDALISSGAVRGAVSPEDDSLIIEYADQGGLTPQQIKKLIQFAEKYDVHSVYEDTDDGSRSENFGTTRELSDFLRGVARKKSLAAQFHESKRGPLCEGWKDVYKQFVDTNKVPEDVFQRFRTEDPSGKNKYLGWMCKQYVLNPDRAPHIIDVVKLFHQQVERGRLQGGESDISKYSLEEADEVAQRAAEKKSKSQVKKEQKSQSTIIEETDDYLIVVPESHEASCFYGANTRWCISGKTAAYWDEYWKKGAKIYIIINKRKNNKFAVAVYPDGEVEAFDEEDNTIPVETIEDEVGVNLEVVTSPATEEELSGRYKEVVDEIVSTLTKNPDGTYSTDGDVKLSSLFLKSLPVRFMYVGGDFKCSNNQLTSLEGAPQEVGGDFLCFNNRLTSLEGAPRRVGRSFYCDDNQLTSLGGAPQEVGGSFLCFNNQLTSLEGAPQEVGGNFYCDDNQLTSLEGAPRRVGGTFKCSNNQLTSLEGAPQEVGGDFKCSNNQLTSLEGAPQKVGGDFRCTHNQLTSLEGAPQKVGESFICFHNQLTSLKGAPQEVGGNFYCDNNQLTSLEGAPQEIGGVLYCHDNPTPYEKLKQSLVAQRNENRQRIKERGLPPVQRDMKQGGTPGEENLWNYSTFSHENDGVKFWVLNDGTLLHVEYTHDEVPGYRGDPRKTGAVRVFSIPSGTLFVDWKGDLTPEQLRTLRYIGRQHKSRSVSMDPHYHKGGEVRISSSSDIPSVLLGRSVSEPTLAAQFHEKKRKNGVKR